MRRVALLGVFMIIPALLVLSATPGCSKKGEDKKAAPPAEEKKDGDVAQRPKKKERTPLEAKSDGVIKGTVVYDGTPPEPQPEPAMKDHKDKEHCLAGKESEKVKQTWMVNKDNKGVANVVVFLEPPDGKYFQVPEKDRELKGKIIKIEQPHCAFIPHVQAAFPSYYDGKKQVKTGEIFEVVNNAGFTHNTRWEGRPFKTERGNVTLTPNQVKPVNLIPDAEPIRFSCDIHSWMSAYVWAFDHPYFAVTDKDGKFEIKDVPTGVEVNVVGWHEDTKRFHEKAQAFMKGDNSLPLKVKK